jgi:hypothetical protein
MSHNPDDAGEEERQEHAEERPGERDDDFIERRNARELCAIDIRVPSMMSIGASCGSFTKPPNGIEPNE